MITFNDTKLYAKGICSAQLADPSTGNIWFSSNKFTTGSINFSANSDPLRAGLGNPIATIIDSDPDITINFTQANFDLAAKMAAVGGSVAYNAIVPVCKTITATATQLTIDITDGVPVAPYGQTSPICYIQQVGTTSLMGADGEAYSIGQTTGLIPGYVSTIGSTYKVWYFVENPTAMVGTVNSALSGRVGLFTAQIAVYSNTGSAANQGTRVGWLYVHALVKLMPEGANLTGDQSNYDTTTISARVISADENVVSASCSDCASSDLMYYVYVADDSANQIVGLTLFGGVVEVKIGTTARTPIRFVLANNDTVPVSSTVTGFTYAGTNLPTGVSINSSTGLITANSSAVAGEGEAVATYSNGGQTFTLPYIVSVVSE